MAQLTYQDLAKIAYEAYNENSEEKVPRFQALSLSTQIDWQIVAEAIEYAINAENSRS